MEDLIQYIIPYLVMPILGIYVVYEFIKNGEIMEIVEYGIPYIVLPAIGVFVLYEFIKMLILNYKDQNGKS